VTTDKKNKPSTILRVSAYLFRYKSLFWLTIGLAAGMTLMEIAVPYAIKVILDDIETTGALTGLFWGVGIIALLYIGSEIFNSLRIRVNNTLEQQVLLEMRRDLHSKLLRLPVSFYDQRKSGEISSRVIEDVAAVERALLDGNRARHRCAAQNCRHHHRSCSSCSHSGVVCLPPGADSTHLRHPLLQALTRHLERRA
jgi:ABC-type multidrug transport system fused ATPase/permease subunit